MAQVISSVQINESSVEILSLTESREIFNSSKGQDMDSDIRAGNFLYRVIIESEECSSSGSSLQIQSRRSVDLKPRNIEKDATLSNQIQKKSRNHDGLTCKIYIVFIISFRTNKT